MIQDFSLSNQTALITGGGTGIGFGIAERFVAAGARVVLAGRREAELAQAVEKLGPAASFEVCDVTRTTELPGVADRIQRTIGPISILVNNAGNHLKKPAVDTTESEFSTVQDIHVLGAFALSRAVGRQMMEAKRGSILFIASMTSFMGMPLVVAYTAAKSATVGLVRALAAEFSPCGVRVNAIAPGWIETPMLHRALDGDPDRKHKILSRTPMNSFGSVSDIGNAAVYLCSPAARFVTGVVLPIDGGASIGF